MRLSDVATVIEGAENSALGALADRTPAIILNVQRQPGANVIATTDAIKAQLPALLKSLPAGLHATVLADRTTGIRASVHDVEFELVLAVVAGRAGDLLLPALRAARPWSRVWRCRSASSARSG